MGNSGSLSSSGSSTSKQGAGAVTHKLLDEVWFEVAHDKLFIKRDKAIEFLETLYRKSGVSKSPDRAALLQLLEKYHEVSLDDIVNVLFLAEDVEVDAQHLSESLNKEVASMVLPHVIVDLSAFEKVEMIHSGQGIETWRARSRTNRSVLLRCHNLAFLRRDCDPQTVVEDMRRLHCQIALKFVGFKLEPKLLTVVYEDPGVTLLETVLKKDGRLNAPPTMIRNMFVRFVKGLLWLDSRKNVRHLQLRPDTIFLSNDGAKLYCIVGEVWLKKRFDMVDVSMLSHIVSFCAPEILSGVTFDSSKSDVFSLAMLLYSCFSFPPFPSALDAADIMELLLTGKRPENLFVCGVFFAPVIARSWAVFDERVTLAELLELLRHPLTSRSTHKLPESPNEPSTRSLPLIMHGERDRELVNSMPTLGRSSSSTSPKRQVPLLLRMPTSSFVVTRVRSTSLSSSTYSETSTSPDLSSRSSAGGSSATTTTSTVEEKDPWLIHLPRCKHDKMLNVPELEQWYAMEHRIQFRVFPVLSEFEMKMLKRRWHHLWQIRKNEGLVPFLGVAMQPFVAEQWSFGFRVCESFVRDLSGSECVALCHKMAFSMAALHRDKIICGPKTSLCSWVMREDKVQLLLGPMVFKLDINSVAHVPPEVKNEGEAWTLKADVYMLGGLMSQLRNACLDFSLARNRVWAKLIDHVISEASFEAVSGRADAEKIVSIFQSTLE